MALDFSPDQLSEDDLVRLWTTNHYTYFATKTSPKGHSRITRTAIFRREDHRERVPVV